MTNVDQTTASSNRSRCPSMADEWFAPGHVPPVQRLESVTSAQPLWRLVKDGHVAEARVRPIEGVGVELRYEWNGELRVSQVFKAWDALEAAATEKRRELKERGWSDLGNDCLASSARVHCNPSMR